MVRALKSIRLRDSVIITNLLISSALLWETCLEARPIWTTGYPSSERTKHRIIISQAHSKRMVQVNIKELVGAKLKVCLALWVYFELEKVLHYHILYSVMKRHYGQVFENNRQILFLESDDSPLDLHKFFSVHLSLPFYQN